RRHIEVDDRAELLLAHDADRHQDRRNQDEEYGWYAGHDRVEALERGVVNVAILEVCGVLARLLIEPVAGICEERALNPLYVPPDRLGAEGVRAIDLGEDVGSVAAAHVATEVRWDLDYG